MTGETLYRKGESEKGVQMNLPDSIYVYNISE